MRFFIWRPSPMIPWATSIPRPPTPSTTTPACGLPPWPSRPASGASCSRPRAATTAGPERILSTRPPRSTPSPPTANRRFGPKRDIARLAGDGFCPVFLRPATAYGVSPRLRFDIVLNNLVAHAVTTGRIYLKSDGSPWRPIVHIEDISRAFIAAAEAPEERVFNQAFNVGQTAHNYRIRDLAEIVASVVPDCKLELRPRRRAGQALLPGQLREDQAHAPRVQAAVGRAQGRRAALCGLSRVRVTLEEFEGPRYQRIAHIRKLMSEGILGPDLRFATGDRRRPRLCQRRSLPRLLTDEARGRPTTERSTWTCRGA